MQGMKKAKIDEKEMKGEEKQQKSKEIYLNFFFWKYSKKTGVTKLVSTSI